jgi:hypothetical protein
MLPNTDTPSARLARALLRDRDKQPSPPAPSCFTCGRTFARRDGRFCSSHCRHAFDRGVRAYEPLNLDRFYNLPKGRNGFLIPCANCRTRFDSPGWACCSAECSRELHRKRALHAELAGDPFRAIKRKCLDCGGDIPNWRNGRRVSKAAFFCSPRCKDRHGKSTRVAPGSPKPALARETAKKPPENGLRRKGDTAASVSAEHPV